MAVGNGSKTCLICGAPLGAGDYAGAVTPGPICIGVNAAFHTDKQSDYCPLCPNKLPCKTHGTTEHPL